jgi:polyferredoxin
VQDSLHLVLLQVRVLQNCIFKIHFFVVGMLNKSHRLCFQLTNRIKTVVTISVLINDFNINYLLVWIFILIGLHNIN